MRIVRVELKNIKSYRDAVIDLQRGVTAIRGHNGAGKSTLLEAIGWALFDFLPYNQSDFVREGETQGRVVVRFVSAKDGREYESVRRCGNGANWFIVDPETGVRIDSAADIQAFLREQLRIESTVALKDLFTSAIGVPQGALTADFLLTPANRKKRFDALLQVEDYRAATDKLSETVNYLKERRNAQDATIQNLEREVERLEVARVELDAARATVAQLEVEAERLESETQALATELAALHQAREALARCEGNAKEAAARLVAARQRLDQTDALHVEARMAAEIVADSDAEHQRYLKAERALAAARERQRARDDLRQQESAIVTRQAKAETEQKHIHQRLDTVAQAERDIVALQPDLALQTELERDLDAAKRNVQKLQETNEQARKLAADLAKLESGVAAGAREVADIESARPEAEALEPRREAVATLREASAVRKQREERRAAIAIERQANSRRRDEAARDEAKMRENVKKLEEVRELVERKGEIEEQERVAKTAVDTANARLQQSKLSRDQAGAGNCPFLAEPCLNIQKRGENSLRGYFDKRIAEEERALIPLTATRDQATAAATDVRTKALHFERLGDFRERLQKAQATLAECDDTAARLDTEEAEISANLKRAGDSAGLAEALKALKASEDADRKLATLESVRRDLEYKREQRDQANAEHARLTAQAAELAGAPEAAQTTQRKLDALNDPRKRNAILVERARERPELEQTLATVTDALGKLANERATVAESLAPYANLDGELAALDAELKETHFAHQRYIQHEKIAEQEPTRARAREEAAGATALAEQAHASAAQALDTARAAFDAGALARADQRSAQLSDARGQNREQQRNERATIAAREEELQRGQAHVTALAAARVEAGELAATQATLQQFRDLIKEAGPLVTRTLLSQISQQANAIFGDIIGDRAGTLAWENEYEIVLRRDGKTRAFAQLSGGEQMTAALAVRLALLRRLTRLDMAFFDEPTQNMDGERRSALAEQLRRVRGFEQLIVISHDDTFEQGLDSVIHLEKHDGATQVAEGEAVFANDPPPLEPLEERQSAFVF